MEENKLILAHCNKTGKKYCLELKNTNGGWLVTNFIEISEADAQKIPADNPDGVIKTAPSLLPCSKCGSRVVGGCSCAKRISCSLSSKYNFQCIYCKELSLDRPFSAEPVIYVTSHCFDNIGKVLDSMKLKYKPFRGAFDCDILFINCGTGDVIDSRKLADFVRNGGCVYISDLASRYVTSAFPGVLNFSSTGSACKIEADVVDQELMQIAGNRIEVEFDLGSWSIITSATKAFDASQGRVLLRASYGNAYAGKPIMVSFSYGKGKVFYTSFHNHAQASEKEKMLLQLLLLKQLGSKMNKTVEQVGDLIGLNISAIKRKFN